MDHRRLTLRDIEAGHGPHAVLKGASLEVGEGEVVALTGGNGAGKSTLIDVVLGAVTPRAGTVSRAAELALVPQRPTLDPHLPVVVSDVVGLAVPRRVRRAPARRLVAESLERVGIPALARSPIGEVSGGQLRRAFLAQALARRADLLLLDEPDAGVDRAGVELLWSLLHQEAARGAGVLLVTHHPSAAARADRVLRLERGVVVSA